MKISMHDRVMGMVSGAYPDFSFSSMPFTFSQESGIVGTVTHIDSGARASFRLGWGELVRKEFFDPELSARAAFVEACERVWSRWMAS